MGTYVQTGNKLAIVFTFANGNTLTVTWYVNQDGSVINGAVSTINTLPSPPGITTGSTLHWTLVENDSCDVEGFLTLPP